MVTSWPADPGRHLLDKIDAREQALAREAEQARPDRGAHRQAPRAQRGDQRPAGHPQDPALPRRAEPGRRAANRPSRLRAARSPGLPADPRRLRRTARPLRARDLCVALDLPIVPKNTENIRSKLKRLVSRGILVETEPGLFTQPRP